MKALKVVLNFPVAYDLCLNKEPPKEQVKEQITREK